MKIGRQARVCVIGAGPSGIAAAKNLLQAGLTRLVVYDRQAAVGGNWLYSETPGGHSSVYETAHIISSRTLSQYHDYPMPAHYPDYPNHRQLKDYFQAYARHFGVEPYIQFNTEVRQVEPRPGHAWRITLGDGRVEDFDHVLVASGHLWNPRRPEYPGTFSGDLCHAHEYRTPGRYRGQRVLVIGGGNSACDIACDVARQASFTGLSWRRGYYVIPKVIFGSPPDVVNARFHWLPRAVRRRGVWLIWRLVTGGAAPYGLPEPDHGILEAHPIANSQLLYWLKHGAIQPRKDIARFDGPTVHFVDGTAEDYDAIIAATGYRITFPFLDPALIDFEDKDVPLYLRVFHPDFPTLYFIGLLQPQGCIWTLADWQARLVAQRITGGYELPGDVRRRIQRDLERQRRIFHASPRHSTEVDSYEYERALRRELPRLAR
ncbi:MAG: NAD(P)-binding domain-containing protein [Anaerolineae bacterium]|nr:NAD(P)-binding domain-containing protein [Anaerolineae bacterium]